MKTSKNNITPITPTTTDGERDDAKRRGVRSSKIGVRDNAKGTDGEELGAPVADVARIGKIARLSREVREELNLRLAEGEEGAEVLAWLNGDARVRVVLAEKFGGRAISKQNLSAWRAGGYEAWCQHQRELELSGLWLEELADFEELEVEGLAERVSALATVAVGKLLSGAMRRADEGPEARAEVLEAVRVLNRLRAGDRRAERAQWEEERARQTIWDARRKLAEDNTRRKAEAIQRHFDGSKGFFERHKSLSERLAIYDAQKQPQPREIEKELDEMEIEAQAWIDEEDRLRAVDPAEFDPVAQYEYSDGGKDEEKADDRGQRAGAGQATGTEPTTEDRGQETDDDEPETEAERVAREASKARYERRWARNFWY